MLCFTHDMFFRSTIGKGLRYTHTINKYGKGHLHMYVDTSINKYDNCVFIFIN